MSDIHTQIDDLQAQINAESDPRERAVKLNQLGRLHQTQAQNAATPDELEAALRDALTAYTDALDLITSEDDLYITLLGAKANIALQLAQVSIGDVRLYFVARDAYDTIINLSDDDGAKNLAMWHQLEAHEGIATVAGTVNAWGDMIAAAQHLLSQNPNSSGLLHTRMAAATFQQAELSDDKADYLAQAHQHITNALTDKSLLEQEPTAYSLTYQVQGDIYARQGDLNAAIEAYTNALTPELESATPVVYANIAYNIAILCNETGDQAQADTHYQQAADTYRKAGMTARAEQVTYEMKRAQGSFLGRIFGKIFGR